MQHLGCFTTTFDEQFEEELIRNVKHAVNRFSSCSEFGSTWSTALQWCCTAIIDTWSHQSITGHHFSRCPPTSPWQCSTPSCTTTSRTKTTDTSESYTILTSTSTKTTWRVFLWRNFPKDSYLACSRRSAHLVSKNQLSRLLQTTHRVAYAESVFAERVLPNCQLTAAGPSTRSLPNGAVTYVDRKIQ